MLVFRNPLLRSLVLFGWLAGFYVLPEGLAAPYAHALHGSTFDRRPADGGHAGGMVIGAFALSRLVAPATRLRLMGWMAMLSCAPLIVSAADPPLGAVLAAGALSGIGRRLPDRRGGRLRAGLPGWPGAGLRPGRSRGLFAAQGLGILIGGAVAQAIGPQLVVAWPACSA